MDYGIETAGRQSASGWGAETEKAASQGSLHTEKKSESAFFVSAFPHKSALV